MTCMRLLLGYAIALAFFQPEIPFGACFIPEEGDVKVIELASGDDLFACAREVQRASPHQ